MEVDERMVDVPEQYNTTLIVRIGLGRVWGRHFKNGE